MKEKIWQKTKKKIWKKMKKKKQIVEDKTILSVNYKENKSNKRKKKIREEWRRKLGWKTKKMNEQEGGDDMRHFWKWVEIRRE